jgi:hypothetical protein
VRGDGAAGPNGRLSHRVPLGNIARADKRRVSHFILMLLICRDSGGGEDERVRPAVSLAHHYAAPSRLNWQYFLMI